MAGVKVLKRRCFSGVRDPSDPFPKASAWGRDLLDAKFCSRDCGRYPKWRIRAAGRGRGALSSHERSSLSKRIGSSSFLRNLDNCRTGPVRHRNLPRGWERARVRIPVDKCSKWLRHGGNAVPIPSSYLSEDHSHLGRMFPVDLVGQFRESPLAQSGAGKRNRGRDVQFIEAHGADEESLIQ